LVPGVEIVLAAALYSGIGGALSLLAAAALLAVFAGVLAYGILRGRNLVCGCFGATNVGPVGWRDVARNVVLIAASLAVATGGGTGAVSWPSARVETVGAEGALAMVVATAAVISVLSAGTLTALFRLPPGPEVAPRRTDR